MAEPKYFVWHENTDDPYRACGTRNCIMPAPDDPRCVWRGDDLAEARRQATEHNKIRAKARRRRLSDSAHLFEAEGE